MKTIFKKSNLPFLEKFDNRSASARDHWLLARNMRTGDGFIDHTCSEFMLLQKGAYESDPWCMCELARVCYEDCGDQFLPMALSWWRKAAIAKDTGALWDLDNRQILRRINRYSSGKTEYANIEMRCALLTEWILTRLGRDSWDELSFAEQEHRVRQLIEAVSVHLHIQPPGMYTAEHLQVGKISAAGLADYSAHKIGILRSEFRNYPRLIQILFHELGHFVLFSMWNGTNADQMTRFGITAQRIKSWHNREMGLEVPTREEDPDSLSYGVYTTWLVYFGV